MSIPIKQISIKELIKIEDFVNDTPSDSSDASYLTDGEILDHVMDKIADLIKPTPYIDDWANQRIINETYKNQPHTI